MKPVLRFFFFIIFISPITSKGSELYLRLYDNSPFTIIFNQGSVTYGCSYFQMNNLAPGNYPLEVYNSCLSASSPCAIPIYRGIVTVPAACQIMAFLDMFNRLQIGNTIPLIPSDSYGYSSANNFRLYRGPRWSNLNDSIGYSQARQLLSEISNTRQKISYLKFCIYFHNINAQKLSELMLEFSFDSERLELATYAYPFTSDRENYYKVYDSLIFNGSKQQLDNHLYYLSSTWRY